MELKEFRAYGLGDTPMVQPKSYCPSGNLYLKLEKCNPNGSIKDRTAYYIIKDLIDKGRLGPDTNLVESSSGNLGMALAFFASDLRIRFLCLVDPTLPAKRLADLEKHGVNLCVVSLGSSSDYREARIRQARELDRQADWIWTNQYDNPANFRAHFETTGPEIWSQMKHDVDYFVCSVGTGGTLCGTAHYLKEQNPEIRVVAIEPKGSTIFGGTPGPYLTAGSGMLQASGIFREWGHVTDYYCQVDDKDSIRECIEILKSEDLSVGITTGSVLVVGSYLAMKYPEKKVVALAPDGGERYSEFFETVIASEARLTDVQLRAYHH